MFMYWLSSLYKATQLNIISSPKYRRAVNHVIEQCKNYIIVSRTSICFDSNMKVRFTQDILLDMLSRLMDGIYELRSITNNADDNDPMLSNFLPVIA
jgi:hypothetical protein